MKKEKKNKMPIEFEYIEADESEEDTEEELGEEEAEDDEYIEEEISEEFEEIEFDMTEGDIDEWISELIRLKDEKGHINLQIDEDLFLKINYDGETEEEI